jgi:hypothetical protein
MSKVVTPPEILNVISNYVQTALKRDIITLQTSGNPRADSLANQPVIGDSLRAFTLCHPLFVKHGLVFEVPSSPQFWCDFVIRTLDDRIWLPINLKVSSFRGRDDLSSKDGLFYALTGKDPEHCDWDRYCQELAAHLKRDNCCADYYYIVVQKSRPGTPRGNVFWTSLLALRCVHPNGNRPPFQCHWAENTERLSWPRKEAVAYLLGVLEETLTLRANASASFKKHLTPMLRGWGPKPV